jgi:hypothetical protein
MGRSRMDTSKPMSGVHPIHMISGIISLSAPRQRAAIDSSQAILKAMPSLGIMVGSDDIKYPTHLVQIINLDDLDNDKYEKAFQYKVSAFLDLYDETIVKAVFTRIFQFHGGVEDASREMEVVEIVGEPV